MIRHTVVFKLKHSKSSQAESSFLKAAKDLEKIPTVNNFECLRQISIKNNFAFGLSMEFDSQEDYDDYNAHPKHTSFVQDRWVVEVEAFMEIDFEVLENI